MNVRGSPTLDVWNTAKYGACLSSPAWVYRLAPLSLDELREVLVNPAWVEAYDFESEDLVDTILQEINYAPGALPLLSFTMGELYRITDKDKRIFTWQNYHKKLGGVTGALNGGAVTASAVLGRPVINNVAADSPAPSIRMRITPKRVARMPPMKQSAVSDSPA